MASFVKRLLTRLSDSVPSPATILIGSTLVGALISLSVLAALYWRSGLYTFSLEATLLLYACGAAAGFGPGLMLANFLSGRGRINRLIIGTIILFLSLHTATAAVFALQYRLFYAYWHANFPSVTWGFQLAFTSAAAIYQFTVDSLYIYYPFALPVFIGLGLWFAWRDRA